MDAYEKAFIIAAIQKKQKNDREEAKKLKRSRKIRGKKG